MCPYILLILMLHKNPAARKVGSMMFHFLVRKLIRDVKNLAQHLIYGVCWGRHSSMVLYILYHAPPSVNNLIVVLVIIEATSQIYTVSIMSSKHCHIPHLAKEHLGEMVWLVTFYKPENFGRKEFIEIPRIID